MYHYLFWLGLAIGYPLLQVWLATYFGWVGTPQRELLFSALTRLPLLGLLLLAYPWGKRERKPGPAAGMGWAVAFALGAGIAGLILSNRTRYLAEGSATLSVFVLAMLVIAATEEYLFRGHLLLARVSGGSAARSSFLIATLSFAGIHAVNGLIYAGSRWSGVVSQMIYALLVGALLGWLALRLRRIWPLVLLHAGLNLALATGRLSEPVFTTAFSLSPLAKAIMVTTLTIAAIAGWRLRAITSRDPRDL